MKLANGDAIGLEGGNWKYGPHAESGSNGPNSYHCLTAYGTIMNITFHCSSWIPLEIDRLALILESTIMYLNGAIPQNLGVTLGALYLYIPNNIAELMRGELNIDRTLHTTLLVPIPPPGGMCFSSLLFFLLLTASSNGSSREHTTVFLLLYPGLFVFWSLLLENIFHQRHMP